MEDIIISKDNDNWEQRTKKIRNYLLEGFKFTEHDYPDRYIFSDFELKKKLVVYDHEIKRKKKGGDCYNV